MVKAYNQGIQKSITVFANAAAASALLAGPDYSDDPYTTYTVVVRDDGKAVIQIADEDGYKLGVL